MASIEGSSADVTRFAKSELAFSSACSNTQLTLFLPLFADRRQSCYTAQPYFEAWARRFALVTFLKSFDSFALVWTRVTVPP